MVKNKLSDSITIHLHQTANFPLHNPQVIDEFLVGELPIRCSQTFELLQQIRLFRGREGHVIDDGNDLFHANRSLVVEI